MLRFGLVAWVMSCEVYSNLGRKREYDLRAGGRATTAHDRDRVMFLPLP